MPDRTGLAAHGERADPHGSPLQRGGAGDRRFDGDGSVIVDRRMRDDIDDERLAPLGGGASERRHR
jgi:hypothetical protein